jgi:hypothetical protein|eukprot:521204_1
MASLSHAVLFRAQNSIKNKAENGKKQLKQTSSTHSQRTTACASSSVKQKQKNQVATFTSMNVDHAIRLHTPVALNGFSNAGSEVSSKEVTLKITKYLDWARVSDDTLNVLNVTFNMEQDFLAPDASNSLGNNAVLCRIKKCRLYAYPRSSNAENATATFAMLTSVPVRGGGGSAELNAHQQSVVIPPTFTPKWHKVFDCNYDKLFNTVVIQPLDSINFPLFNTSLVDVDDFSPLKDQAIQLKLEIEVAQTVPLRSNILLGVAYQADYVNSTATSSDTLAFVQVTGMSNAT